MRNFQKALVGVTTGLVLAVGVGTSTQAVAAENTSAKSGDTFNTPAGVATKRDVGTQGLQWKVCDRAYIAYCWWDPYDDTPPRSADLRNNNFNDTMSSLATNSWAIETWNDINFQGTYGYFQPHTVWNVLSYPYDNAVSSMSYK